MFDGWKNQASIVFRLDRQSCKNCLARSAVQHALAQHPTAMMDLGADGSRGDSSDVFVFIVQRSGYAGLQQSQAPVDYRRLLMSRNEADQIAYGSAHQYSNGSPVRTIQLPDGSFGFVASNYLFWVRKVSATATTASDALKFGEAHCVLSDGLLGGTAKRRNMLLAEKHSIFVGPHSSHAALNFLMQHPHLTERGAKIQWVPVGPPPSLAQLTQEWPFSEQSMEDHSTSSKRSVDDDENFVWFNRRNADKKSDEGMMLETTRSTKRACWRAKSPLRRNRTTEAMVIE